MVRKEIFSSSLPKQKYCIGRREGVKQIKEKLT